MNSFINIAPFSTNKNGQELKKDIVDLSKTKKRKEFEHDNKIKIKLSNLVQFSQISEK